MKLLPWRKDVERDLTGYTTPISLQEYIDSYFVYGNTQYPIYGNTSYGKQGVEEIEASYAGFGRQCYKSNGIVFACIALRMRLFSEARFQFQQLSGGRPGDLFGTPALALLENPWPGATTGDLLARAELDVSLCGNSFWTRQRDGLKRLRPEWVDIVLGDPEGDDPQGVYADVVGYAYWPGGRNSGNDPIPYARQEVAHYAPVPDPDARYRGMSWLTPVIREVMADSAARDHKIKFFENSATVNLFFNVDPAKTNKEAFDKFVDSFKAKHEGVANAYKALFLRGAADVTPIGADMQQMDFKTVQGAGETRIAAAAGVPPVIVGLSEGLAAATYSNYGQARRALADGTLRPLWRNMAGSLETIVQLPGGARLWYDDRDIPFVQEDEQDAATVRQTDATTIKLLIDAGFDPESVVSAVNSGDFSRLSHSGLVSVQLQEPGTPAQNGSGQLVVP